MAQNNFLDAYEANAKVGNTLSTGYNPNITKPVETEDFNDFSTDVTNGVQEPKYKVDVSSILRDINVDADESAMSRKPDGTLVWDENGKTDNERYITQGIMEGRINVDDIDDDDAPYAVAAVSHAMFGNKSDFDGVILSNTMKNWNKHKSNFNEGYNPDTKTWNPKVILKEFKKAWDYVVERSAEKKNALLNADAIANGWVKEGDKPFFSDDDSFENLDYRFGIASKNLGSMDSFKQWDESQSKKIGWENGIDTSLIGERGWKDPALFGFRDLMEGLGRESSRAFNTALESITGDDVGRVENGIHFHNAGQDAEADAFIIRRACEAFGLKNNDYAGLVKAIYNNDDSHSAKLKDGTIIHVNEKNKNGNSADYIWIESGNEVSRKLGVINEFCRQQADSIGTIRMAHAIDMLCGNKDAAEGVAIYMSGRKTSDTNFWDNGDEEGLRIWANNYLSEGKEDEQAKRFHTVQTAFDAIQNMRQTEGFFGTSSIGRFSAAVGNLGVKFLDNVGDMGSGAYDQSKYYIERGISKIGGETDAERIKAHREQMVHQQIKNLVAGNWNGEGTVWEFAGEKILEFKAFELVFSARFSAFAKPVKPLHNWLTKSRTAERAAKMSRAEKLGKKIDDICDGLIANQDIPHSEYVSNIERMSKLRAAKESQLEHMKELLGDGATVAKLKDACVKVLNNAPNFYTIYASSVNDMEKADSDRLADVMDSEGKGFDEKLWTDAQDIIKARGVASTAFLLDLGRFLRKAKLGVSGNKELSESLKYIDEQCKIALKNKDANFFTALMGGFKVAKAELVEGTMRPMFKMGFGMGATEQLGSNIEDTMLGIVQDKEGKWIKGDTSWGDIDRGVVGAGFGTGTLFAGTGALMKTLPHLERGPNGFKVNQGVGIDALQATLYYNYELNVARQEARPEEIMSSYIAKNYPNSISTGNESSYRDQAQKAFSDRFIEFIKARLSGDKEALKTWYNENVRLFGKNGADNFNALFENMKYSSIEWIGKSIEGIKLNADSVSTILTAGGYKIGSAVNLPNGDVEINASASFGETPDGKTKIWTDVKFLIHNGKIFIKQDNGKYNPNYVIDCISELNAGRAHPEVQAKWEALTPEERRSIEDGNDVNGILGDSRWTLGGWFGGKKEIDNASNVQNLVDVTNPTIYDGIARFANGGFGLFSFRHEMLGHAAIEAMRKSGILKKEDITALEDAYGKDWEEKVSNDAARTAGIKDAELIKHIIGDVRGGALATVRRKAEAFLRSIKVMKEAAGTPETFNVGEFIKENVKRAHELHNLNETQRKAVELARKQAEELAIKADAEAKKARQEADALYLKNLDERKRTGKERAVQIARQRELLGTIQAKIEDLALKFDTIEKFEHPTTGFNAKVEEIKKDTIQHLKKLGMDKGEIGIYVENTLLNTISNARNQMSEMLKQDKIALDAAVEAERVAKEEESRAKAESKAKYEQYEQARQAKIQNKKQGEKLAKQIGIAKKAYFDAESMLWQALNNFSNVNKFDTEVKRILKHFDGLVKESGAEISTGFRKDIKTLAHDLHKKMELKADAIRIKEENRIAKEKAAKEAAKKKADIKRKQEEEQKKALREAHRKEIEANRKKEAEARQAQKEAEIISAGVQLMQMGLPVPNKNVICGLKGEALAKKREFMRQAGYYYSKDLDCWVNKNNAPEAFKKAASETVKETIDEIANVKTLMNELGIKKEAQEAVLKLANKAKGRATQEDPATTPPTSSTANGGEVSAQTKANDKALREAEDAIREMGELQGWDEKEVNRQIKLMRARGVKSAIESAPELKPIDKPEVNQEVKESEPPAPPLANVKDEKIWWRNQLTPQERLGLGVVEVDGKPWAIVYCPGEVISGNEKFSLTKGELPDGAIIKPFSKRSFDAAIEKMTDDDAYDTSREVTGEIKHSHFFDYKLRRIKAQNRKETIERNKQEREEAARVAAEQEAKKAKDSARDMVMTLLRERHGIEEAVKKEPLDIERLGMKVLAEIDIRYPFNQYYSNVELAGKRMGEIDAEVKRLKEVNGINDIETIEGGIKNGHFCVSMALEPETALKLKRMLPKLAKSVRKTMPESFLKNNSRFENDSEVVWFASNTADETAKMVNTMLASIGVTTTGHGLVKGESGSKHGFLQEYPETYRTREEWKDSWDAANELVEKGIKEGRPEEYNNFRLDFFLGEESPLLQKFPWLNLIPVRFGTKNDVDFNEDSLENGKTMAFFATPDRFENPFGELVFRESHPSLGRVAHEIQHAFQYYERQGFLMYSGRKYEGWRLDSAENQSEAVSERAWFDQDFRKEYPFTDSEMLLRPEQKETAVDVFGEEHLVSNRLGRNLKLHEMMDADMQYDNMVKFWNELGHGIGDVIKSAKDSTEGKNGGMIGGDGYFNVMFKHGAENVIRFGRPTADAERIIKEHMIDFIGGPVNRAAHSILEMGFIRDKKRSIPNWLINQVIEQKGDNLVVTLDSGVKIKAILTGAGNGNVIKKLDEAKESKNIDNINGEIVWEYAGDKATIPHNFVESIIEDEKNLRTARAEAKSDKDKLRKTLEDSGVSKLAMGKLEKSGVFKTDEIEVLHRQWYLSDFFPNDKILETAYPKIYAETEIVPYGGERSINNPNAPLFAEGQLANLGADGKIYVKVDTKSRVRANGEIQHTLVRDIGASLVKAIRREDGLGDDIARSPDYFTKSLQGIDFLNSKTKANGEKRNLRFKDNFGFGQHDSIMKNAANMVIGDRFDAIAKFTKTLSFSKTDIENAKKQFIAELDAAIAQSFNEFYAEQEAIMFANRFGKDISSLDGISESMKDVSKKSVIRMDDPRFTQEDKMWSYINFYGNVLRKIDAVFGSGSVEHQERSVVRKFERLMTEYMLSRRIPQLEKSGELKALLGYMNEAMAERRTELQRQGDSEKYKIEVVDDNNPIKEIEAREEAERLERLRAINDKTMADSAKPDMVECCKVAWKFMKDTNYMTLVHAAKAKVPETIAKMNELIKKCYPKFSEAEVNAKRHDILSAAAESMKTSEKAEIAAGRFHVTSNNVEENIIASVASKIAWEKSKHRTANISNLAESMTGKVKTQLMNMGIPEKDAKVLSESIIADAQYIANDIVNSVDATVNDAQLIAQARTKAANIRIGNDVYRSFRKGFKTAIDGEDAINSARKTLEKTRLKAVKRASGFSVSEMNSMLGTDIISDLMKIGDGGKYANGREFAEDMLGRYYQAFRNANPELANATNYELDNNEVFRADFAATISSWLVESAKALAYGQARELAIRDAARVKNTLPPTISELLKTIEHHSEMLGLNIGKMSVEKTLHDIEKLIDNRPKILNDGTIEAGANGGKAISETARVYQRDIAPRLQQYWKFVKEAIWFDKNKVDAQVKRLQESLCMSDSDIVDIEGKNPSELTAESMMKKDLAVLQINALRRYGALKERSAGEVMDVYMNDITKDLAYAAEKFLTQRKERIERDAKIKKDIMDGLTKSLDAGKGFDDIGKSHQWGRRFYYWNVPDLFAKLSSSFNSDSEGYKRVEELRQNVSLAHEMKNRIQSEYQKRLFTDVEEIYGESLDKFARHACLPEAKYDRFSRSGWSVPETGGRTVKIPTGKFYTKDLPKLGVKKGDEIMRTVTLAERGADPTRRDKHLSLANLIYIYAACRQSDMAVNNLVFGRDAAYIADLEHTIGAEGIALADRMVRNYSALRELVSPVSERVTGMPVMSPNELYVPLEFVQDKKASRVTRYELNPYPKFLMNRKYHDASNLDESVDFLGEYIKRSEDSAHYAAFAELADHVRTTFGDDKIVSQYHNLIGSKAAGALFKQLNECFNGGTNIEDSFGVGFRNFVTATTLGYNPSSCLKQLEGIGGWAVGMSPIEWSKAVTFDHIFNRDMLADALNDLHSSGLFQKHGMMWERSEGISEPMIMLMNARNAGTAKALNFYQKMKENYAKHSMDFIRFFDSVSSNWGAGSYYASRKRFYQVEQKLGIDDAKRLALADTDYMMQVSQQSGRPEFMHEWQRGGIGGRFLTQFVGPTLVRAGLELEAAHRHFRVERTQQSFNRLFSKLIAGHVICPMMLATVSQLTSFFFGNRDDKNADLWDDFSTNLLISMAIGPMNGMLIIGQIADATVRKAALWDSNNRSHSRRHFESPVTSKLGQLADGFVTTTMDTATLLAPMMEGQDLNPAMLRQVQDDLIRDLQQVIPALRLLNAVPNTMNYIEKKKRDARREERLRQK